jgi:hypothetical protein
VAHARLEGLEDEGLDVVLEDGVEELGLRREVDDQVTVLGKAVGFFGGLGTCGLIHHIWLWLRYRQVFRLSQCRSPLRPMTNWAH